MLPDRTARRITPQISIYGTSGSRAARHLDSSNVVHGHGISSCGKRQVTINILPDDAILLIFHFGRLAHLAGPEDIDRLSLSWRWDRLAHVCRRWRSVVFASPNFLDLKLVFRPWTPIELTSIWPPLPIVINGKYDGSMPKNYNFEAATMHHNRICVINLFHIKSSQYQQLASAMQRPFPVLKHLGLGYSPIRSRPTRSRPTPPLPDGFLGGSAPSLQSLSLHFIPFPALPKLLLTTTNLLHLSILRISSTWYTSPDAIVTCLAMLTSLRYLHIGFLSQAYEESQHSMPPRRTVVPALTRFVFTGNSGYLENLVARIDTHLLDSIYLTLFDQPVLNIPQLAQFMRRTTRFQALNEAHVVFDSFGVRVGYLPPTQTVEKMSGMGISCLDFDWQLPYLPQIFTSFFPSIHIVEHLYIYEKRQLWPQLQDNFDNMRWLGIFHPFIAVKDLYLSKEFASRIAPALQDLNGGRTTEVLPSLQNIFLEGLQLLGPIEERIREFVAVRQLSGRPITVSLWERDSKRD